MRSLLKAPIISLIFLQSIIIIALAGMPNHADLHTKVVNGSAASGHPQFFYPTTHQTIVGEEGRDPRQWLNSYGGMGGYGSPYGMGLGMFGGAELILTCLLVILGIGVIGQCPLHQWREKIACSLLIWFSLYFSNRSPIFVTHIFGIHWWKSRSRHELHAPYSDNNSHRKEEERCCFLFISSNQS